MLVLGMAACGRRPVPRLMPTEVLEYEIPWENAFPSDVVVDTAGEVWFTDRLAHVLGRFDPATAAFDSVSLPTAKSAPYGFIEAPDGGLWYAASRAGLLGRLDPATGRVSEYRIPGAVGGPQQLAWVDGVIWFSLRDANSVGWFDPRTGENRVFEIEGSLKPYSIAVTAAGTVWFSTYDAGYLIEVDTRTYGIRIHDLGEAPTRGAYGTLIESDSAGARRFRAIRDSAEYAALPDSVRSRVRLNRVRGREKRIAADAQGRIWIADFGGGRLIRFDPATREHVSYRMLAATGGPYGITTTADGRVWFGETGNGALVVLDPESGERTRVPMPTPGGTIRNLAVDLERGFVWLPLSDIGRLAVARLR